MWGGGLGGSASAGDILQTFVQTEGDDTLPLSVAAFNAEVRAATGVSEEKPVPGFNKYYPIFRKGHAGTVFVHDDEGIPEAGSSTTNNHVMNATQGYARPLTWS